MDLICLVSGKAKIFRTGVAGREHIIKMLKVHDITGFQTLFTESTWPASAIAIEESIICTIEKQCLLRILRNNADLSMKISKILSEELSYSYDKMVSLIPETCQGTPGGISVDACAKYMVLKLMEKQSMPLSPEMI